MEHDNFLDKLQFIQIYIMYASEQACSCTEEFLVWMKEGSAHASVTYSSKIKTSMLTWHPKMVTEYCNASHFTFDIKIYPPPFFVVVLTVMFKWNKCNK